MMFSLVVLLSQPVLGLLDRNSKVGLVDTEMCLLLASFFFSWWFLNGFAGLESNDNVVTDLLRNYFWLEYSYSYDDWLIHSTE